MCALGSLFLLTLQSHSHGHGQAVELAEPTQVSFGTGLSLLSVPLASLKRIRMICSLRCFRTDFGRGMFGSAFCSLAVSAN